MANPKKNQNATLLDVAQLAGVSKATASKALNNVQHVNDETRQRVVKAANKLNFKPNNIARSLKAKQTLTIGLVTDDLDGLFTTAMVRGVEETASAQGFNVFLCNSYGDAQREREHLDVLVSKRVDGIILLGYRTHERGAPALDLKGLPVVYLYQYTHAIAVPAIIPDDFGGGVLGTRHLIDLGRTRIAFINGPTNYEATHQRLAGYRQALEVGGLRFDPTLVQVGTWHEDSGYAATHQLMALPDPPDSIFCASDSLAIGALDALHELAYRVPMDISLVGYDNRPHSAYQRPPLTTVALPFYEMGKLAGELLLSAVLDDITDGTLYQVPCYLVKRQSCGAQLSTDE